MDEIEKLMVNNLGWSRRMTRDDPAYFEKLAAQQAPRYLWIGCSDSRVPANEILDLMPGELFVHRNVANLVYASDLNCLSVIQYAVGTLKVEHIFVVGHYGCGGIKAAIQQESHGLIDNWLNKVRELYARHRETLADYSEEDRVNRMCELNVIEQVHAVSQTTIVQEAWAAGHPLTIHGWCYGLKDGLIKNLNVQVNQLEEVDPAFRLVAPK